jgi:hypothetical protein
MLKLTDLLGIRDGHLCTCSCRAPYHRGFSVPYHEVQSSAKDIDEGDEEEIVDNHAKKQRSKQNLSLTYVCGITYLMPSKNLDAHLLQPSFQQMSLSPMMKLCPHHGRRIGLCLAMWIW